MLQMPKSLSLKSILGVVLFFTAKTPRLKGF
jgi:hypothetical protein